MNALDYDLLLERTKKKKKRLRFLESRCRGNSAENAKLVFKWTDRMFLAPHLFVIALDLRKPPGGGRGVLWMTQWLQKSKPQKIPRASNETRENPWTKINPQNIACRISKP